MAGIIEPKPFGTFLDTPPPVQRDWIGTGFLPRGGTCTISAVPKVGKSLVSLELCRALVTGENPWGCPSLTVPEPARVLYVEQEVKEAGLHLRGTKIFDGVNRDMLNHHMWVHSGLPEMQFDDPMGWKILRDSLTMTEPNVLILDPIGRMLGGLDENSNSEIGRVLSRLDQVLKDYASSELSLIIVHHSKKPYNDTDALSPHQMRGASRFYANPDTIMMLDRTKDYRNTTGGTAWEIEAHVETRQAEPLPNLIMKVNDEADLRVKFKWWKGAKALAPEAEKKKKETVVMLPVKEQPKQLSFQEPEKAPWKGR